MAGAKTGETEYTHSAAVRSAGDQRSPPTKIHRGRLGTSGLRSRTIGWAKVNRQQTLIWARWSATGSAPGSPSHQPTVLPMPGAAGTTHTILEFARTPFGRRRPRRAA